MGKLNYSLIVLIAAGLISCKKNATENTEIDAIEIQTAPIDFLNEKLELNDGQKWLVNEEMKPHVLAGSHLVNQFLENEDDDFKRLVQELTEQNNQLIESCTMKGKSHDELHKWLHPHLEMTKKLDQVNDTDEAKDIVQELKKSYTTYDEYFQ